LSRVQSAQHSAVAQTDAAEQQVQRAESLARQLAKRIAQLVQSSESITAVEGRLNELSHSTEAVDRKIQSLADHDAMVQAVKAEVDNIRQISSRSRSDLEFVAERRGEVTELRAKVDGLIGLLGETDGRIVQIESRRKVVEEV